MSLQYDLNFLVEIKQQQQTIADKRLRIVHMECNKQRKGTGVVCEHRMEQKIDWCTFEMS